MNYIIGYLAGYLDRNFTLSTRNAMLSVVPKSIAGTGQFKDGFDNAVDGGAVDGGGEREKNVEIEHSASIGISNQGRRSFYIIQWPNRIIDLLEMDDRGKWCCEDYSGDIGRSGETIEFKTLLKAKETLADYGASVERVRPSISSGNLT